MRYRNQQIQQEYFDRRERETRTQRSAIAVQAFYLTIVSRELVASYFWNGSNLEFICQTRFSSRLEISRTLKEEAGRRSSEKVSHRHSFSDSERHADHRVDLESLVRLHLESLQASIQNRDLPFLYQSDWKILSDRANRSSIKAALSSSSSSPDFISTNFLGDLSEFNPNSKASTDSIKKLLASESSGGASL